MRCNALKVAAVVFGAVFALSSVKANAIPMGPWPNPNNPGGGGGRLAVIPMGPWPNPNNPGGGGGRLTVIPMGPWPNPNNPGGGGGR